MVRSEANVIRPREMILLEISGVELLANYSEKA
jgi:hypothetical protein